MEHSLPFSTGSPNTPSSTLLSLLLQKALPNTPILTVDLQEGTVRQDFHTVLAVVEEALVEASVAGPQRH